MLHKYRFLTLGMLVILFTASGCFDLFAVPGVSVSPNGEAVYFLSGSNDAMMSDEGEFISSLTAVSVNDGSTIVIAEGSDTVLISAFDVNPADSSVAYVRSEEEGGTTIELFSGGSSEIVADLPANTIGTMAQFSPDGAYLAVTVVVLPEELDGMDTDNLTDEQFDSIEYALYLVDMADYSATVINDTSTSRANTMAWSPDSTRLVYNAWIDSNADGVIDTAPPFDEEAIMSAPVIDLSQLFVYSVADGSTTQIDTTSVDYSPAFVSDDQVAFVALDYANVMMGSLPAIMVYDFGSGETTSVYQAQGIITGIALSPDGTQVAWTEGAADDSNEDNPPGILQIADTDFNSQMSISVDVSALPDSPVWLNNDTVLVSASNILGSLVGSFTVSLTGGEAESDSTFPMQQILAVNTTDGTIEILYEGAMLNSSFATSLIVLIDSGSLDDMGFE